MLNKAGGFLSDLTVMRLGDDHFRVVTGGAHGMADRKTFTDQLPDSDTTLTDVTDAVSTIGLWGPKARDILASLTSDDVSDEGFGFLTCREISVDGTTVLASRISYVGELGWELYVPYADAAGVWDALLDAGAPHGAVPVGIGVYGTTGRIEKGYRAYGAELDAERTIIEAGMQRPKVKAADFVGKEAYLAQREAAPKAVLCTLTVDDHTSASGIKRYMLGGEPILTRDGGTLTDGHGHHPYVTTAGSAPTLGKHVLLAYLPPEQAVIGTELAVSYMEELYPVTVGSVDATPLLDPGKRAHPMTNVLVCVKRVVDSSGEVVLTDDGQSVDGRFAGFTVSAHEECAVELAVQVAAATEGTASVMTLGDADAVEQLRSALAVGCTAATHVEADASLFGPADVAREIAAVAGDRPRTWCCSATTPPTAVTSRSASGWPTSSAGRSSTAPPRSSVEDSTVVASVAGPDGHETYRVPLPAVVTVLEGGVEPRYPTVPGRMKAKKVEIEQRSPAAEPTGPKRVRLSLPPPQPSDVQILGKGAEAAPAVVDLFERLGVLAR